MQFLVCILQSIAVVSIFWVLCVPLISYIFLINHIIYLNKYLTGYYVLVFDNKFQPAKKAKRTDIWPMNSLDASQVWFSVLKQQTHQLRLKMRPNVCKIISLRPGHTRRQLLCVFSCEILCEKIMSIKICKELHFFCESKPPEALPLRVFLLRFFIRTQCVHHMVI